MTTLNPCPWCGDTDLDVVTERSLETQNFNLSDEIVRLVTLHFWELLA